MDPDANLNYETNGFRITEFHCRIIKSDKEQRFGFIQRDGSKIKRTFFILVWWKNMYIIKFGFLLQSFS